MKIIYFTWDSKSSLNNWWEVSTCLLVLICEMNVHSIIISCIIAIVYSSDLFNMNKRLLYMYYCCYI